MGAMIVDQRFRPHAAATASRYVRHASSVRSIAASTPAYSLAGGHVIENHSPRGSAMAAFDAAMRLRQREPFDRQAIVNDEWMMLERGRRPLRRIRIELAALVVGTLDEDRGDGCCLRPALSLRVLVEHGAILARFGKQLDAIEARQIHAEPTRILEEQIGMRLAGDHAAGLFLVEILGEVAPDLGDGALYVRPADHHRKVANVGRVFLLEMNVELVLRDVTRREVLPRPVHLALHDRQECFPKAVSIHSVKFTGSGCRDKLSVELQVQGSAARDAGHDAGDDELRG
jgi:hypothetical protein